MLHRFRIREIHHPTQAINATGDQYQVDLFFRYNESIQRFFDLSAQLDTAFGD